MEYELNAIIVNSKNEVFDVYEKDLEEFGYIITHCKPKVSEIIARSIFTDCDLILLSHNDFDSIKDIAEIVEYFYKNKDKHIPLILNAPTNPSLYIDKLVSHYSFIHNIYPTGEKRSIILDIERNENFRAMRCDKLLYLLRLKSQYDCGYIGLNKNQEGYRWIAEAVLLILADSSYRKNFISGVYKILGNKYNATYTQIEPAIRRCIKAHYSKIEPLIKVYYFDLDLHSNERYTTTGFINKIVDNIKLQYKNNYDAYIEKSDHDRRTAMKEHFKMDR